MSGRPVSLAPRQALEGREDLLADLDRRLSGGDGRAPRIVALYGLGGIGKTSLAVEYAHRHQHTAQVAWQFACEDPTVLAAEFSRLSAQLGATSGPLDPRDAVASVHAVLASSDMPWLLVYDNAEDQAAVRAFLPPAGNGRVLITTQSALWPSGQAIEIPVLGESISVSFLADRTGDMDADSAAELAGELGGLPLALEQAAAYIQATGGSLAGYLAEFRQRRAELLARGEPVGYGKTVATTWALAFSRLEQDAPHAARLLRLLACCAPEPVPLRLLLQASDFVLDTDVAQGLALLVGDWLAAADAVAALRRYSLVTPAADGMVLVHRLVQAVTLDKMPEQLAAQYQRAAAALIDTAVPADTDSPETWSACAVLLPHARAALPAGSGAIERISTYLAESGSYTAARDLSQSIADARVAALGAEHPDTLTARHNLARWTGEAGDRAGARDQFAALLPVFERVSGAEHPDTLTARGNLAIWTGEAGDAAAARDQFAALLPVVERVSGAEHPDTLSVRGNLAIWTGQAGDTAAARDQFAALLPARERVSGAEHPDTLTVRANLGHWTGQAGDAAAARDQYAVLLPVVQRVSGAEHPDTLTVRGDLAGWTGQAGDAAAARDQYAALLPARERVSGAEHPDTLNVRANLAGCTGQAGDAAAARDQYTALLPVVQRVSGAEHPETLKVRANLAGWTGQAGNPAGARGQFALLVPVLKKVLGLRHPDTIASRNSLAYWTTAVSRRPPSRRRRSR